MTIFRLLTIEFVIIRCFYGVISVDSWTLKTPASSLFVPTKQNHRSLLRSASISMYFDDVSRNTLKWTIPSSSSTGSSSTKVIPTLEYDDDLGIEVEQQQQRHKERSIDEIRNLIDEWVRTTDGIMYNPLDTMSKKQKTVKTPMYQNVLGPTIVCDSKTIYGSVSQFWNTVIPTILDSSNIHQFSLQRWIMVPDVTFVQFIAFPFSPISTSSTTDSYNDWIRFKSILEYSLKEHTDYITKAHFSFHLFHANQTTLSSDTDTVQPPPYPILALQYKPSPKKRGKQQEYDINVLDRTPTSDNVSKDTKTTPSILKAFTRKDNDDEDDEEIANDVVLQNIINEPLIDIFARRNSIQRIYNSEAGHAKRITDEKSKEKETIQSHTADSSKSKGATSINEDLSILRKFFTRYHENYICGEQYNEAKELGSSLSLVRNFDLEYRLRKRSFTNDEIQAISKEWVAEQTFENNPVFFPSTTSHVMGTASATTALDPSASMSTTTTSSGFWFSNFISKGTNQKLPANASPVEQSVETTEKEEVTTNKTTDTINEDNQQEQRLLAIANMQWFVSSETCGEGVFGDFWSSLDQLHEYISMKQHKRARKFSVQSSSSSTMRSADDKKSEATSVQAGGNNGSEMSTNKDDVYTNLYSWMNKIVKPVVVHEGNSNSKNIDDAFDFDNEKGSSSFDIRKLIVLHEESESFRITGYNNNNNNDNSIGWDTRHDADGSIMFVATNLYPYNAEAFKRFAITLFLTMRRSLQILNNIDTDDNTTTTAAAAIENGHKNKINYYLEVFHPEYVASKKGYNHKLRRSPFPMIQVLYQIV